MLWRPKRVIHCYCWDHNTLLKFIIPLFMMAGAAFAQETAPTPLELQTMRAAAAETQAKYFAAIIRAMNAQEKATDDWWASYVAGLSKVEDGKK
jgi:hypothetical protein